MSNRPIPKIGTALLLLGGCYSSRPVGGGGGEGTAAMIARSYCEELAACDAAYVDDAFGGLAGCADEVAYWLAYDAEQETLAYGAACGDAFLAYYECRNFAFDGCLVRSSYEEPFFVYDYAALDVCSEAGLDACPVRAAD
jgi:hypothetical protein